MLREILPFILLLQATYTDIKRREISVMVLLIFGFLSILCLVFGMRINTLDFILGVMPGIVLAIISIITKGELGMGDAIVILVLGAYFGFVEICEILLFALLFSALFSILLLIFKRTSLKREYPFVPFLLGSFIFVHIF